MRRYKLIAGILLLILAPAGVAAWRAMHAADSDRTVETEGQSRQWVQASFDRHLNSLTRKDDTVQIGSDGFYVVTTDQRGDTVFSVGRNEQFRTRPDHHFTTSFQVQQIEYEGVIIRYEHRFDHRSFGKNLITFDRGTVKLKWRTE